MPIPLAAAIIGSAVAGAGASIYAGNKAANATQRATEENNQLQREIYDRNQANLQPYINQGYTAGAQLNDLLAPQGRAGEPDWEAYLREHQDVREHADRVAAGGGDRIQAAKEHYAQYGEAEGRYLPTFAAPPGGAEQPIFGPPVEARPEFERPIIVARPSYSRPSSRPLDVSLGAYEKSPDFEFQMSRGLEALKSDRTLNGLLNSGAALKGALDFSQNLALGDYGQWRDYVTGQHNRDRDFSEAQFQSDRAFGNANYNLDRARQDGIFADDRAFGTGTWEADRAYDTSRFDTRLNSLMDVNRLGLGAAGSLAGVGQNYASSVGANNTNQAGITANAALAGAGQLNSLLGSLAYTYGRQGSSYGSRNDLAGLY